MPMFVPVADVNWMLDVSGKTISDLHLDYKRYCAVADNYGIFSSNVPAEAIDDLDYVFAKEVL